MNRFEREERYMVVKLSKISDDDADAIYRYANYGKALVGCVVVEEDWPEYEVVWKMIQDRVEGSMNE